MAGPKQQRPDAQARHDGRAADPVRLHVVTGKGGTGKTSIAAALSMSLAAGGRRVLVCEVEGRQGLAQLFDIPPLPYAEQRVSVGADGTGELYALAIDPESALLEYLRLYYRMGRAGQALDRFGVIDFATTIAPGVRDVLLTGKVYEAVRRNRRSKHARSYDAVVLDAPPTGRIARFLNVNQEVSGLAKVGPVRHQADAIMSLLRSPQTAVHLVTVLEEMPVQETVDAADELERADLPVGAVVVNRVAGHSADPPPGAPGAGRRPSRARARTVLEQVGVPATTGLVDGLLAEGEEAAVRRGVEEEQRQRVLAMGRRTVELPRLPAGVDSAGLRRLAAVLGEADLCQQSGSHPDPAGRTSGGGGAG